MSHRPVTETDLDNLRADFEGVLSDLRGLTRQVEVAGVERTEPLHILVYLTALSEAAAGLARAIASHCAMAEY